MDVEYSADIGTQLALPTYIVSKIRMRHISIANTLHYALIPCVLYCTRPSAARNLFADYNTHIKSVDTQLQEGKTTIQKDLMTLQIQ